MGTVRKFALISGDLEIMEKRTLFWDVDTQHDFMMPSGKLYVQGAKQIIPVVSDLRTAALENGCSIIASMDWHSEQNLEISDNPDYRTTFPPHCMAGSPGAQRVGYLGDLPIHTVDLKPRNPVELADLVRRGQFHIAIHKATLNVFSNPNTGRLLDAIPFPPEQIVVFGVALDFCVKATLQELSRFRNVQLLLVRDATRAVVPEAEGQVLDEMERRGVRVVESSHLHEMAPCG
jgi:nicotinamidase/pyrazinamidase